MLLDTLPYLFSDVRIELLCRDLNMRYCINYECVLCTCVCACVLRLCVCVCVCMERTEGEQSW